MGKLFWLFNICLCVLCAANAEAKKKSAPEVYPAVIAGENAPGGAQSADEDGISDSLNAVADEPRVPEQPKEDKSPIPDRPAREAAAFDPVPSDQIRAIAKRVKIVERILLKHGRAYDYRTLTLKELEAIARELDRHSKN